MPLLLAPFTVIKGHIKCFNLLLDGFIGKVESFTLDVDVCGVAAGVEILVLGLDIRVDVRIFTDEVLDFEVDLHLCDSNDSHNRPHQIHY